MSERKTMRKNKTNLSVVWPSNDDFFTIKSLSEKNPAFINITLRVRLNKAIEGNLVAEIGSKNFGKGRPIKIFTMMPVKQSVIEKAVKDGVMLKEGLGMTVPIVNVNQNTTKTPVITVSKTGVVTTVHVR